ncbi:MAG: phospholipase C [Nitrososphaerales archaeon]
MRASNAPSPIKNIVIILQENHTFDNYFGTYPGAEGVTGKNLCLPQTSSDATTNCVSPFHDLNLEPVNMNHNWNTAHASFNNGKMDGFIYSERNKETMGYYDRRDISHYWNAAGNYVLCDHYFTSVMSESAPNHLYLVAATSGGIKDDNVPSTLNFPPIFQQLDQKGISWKVYGFTQWYESFEYVQGTPATKNNFAAATVFTKDLSSKKLPQVSWIIGAPGGDEHPPANIQAGENSVANDIVNAIGSSLYWNSSAIFVTWDDYGGFYDHVAPPQIDQFGYGFRVPCLIISPYSKPGFIDSTVNDHTSILRFLEDNFGLASLSTRDSTANNLGEAFDYSKAARAFVSI